jgi:hypothetical protein
MDCEDIRAKFSAYIDDVLSTQEKMAIDEHLKSCLECAAALADLKKTIEHVKGLETVEPPVWMKQKIMTKVRAEAQPKKGLLQKLFYPLQIKLPVGALATIAIALTTLYIFKTIEPEIKLAKAPIEEAAPQIFQKGQQPAQKEAEADKVTPSSPPLPPPSHPLAERGKADLETGKSAPARPFEGLEKVLPSSPLAPPVPPSNKGVFAGKTAPVPERPAEKPTSSKEPESMRDRFKATPKAPEPMKQAEIKQEQKAPALGKDASTPATGALAKGEARQETRAAAPKAKLSLMEKKDEKVLSFTVLVKDPETAAGEIEKTLRELEGKAVRTESVEGKKIVTGEINTSKLKELVVRLKAVGKVKEKDIDFEAMKGEVGIRIEVVSITAGR